MPAARDALQRALRALEALELRAPQTHLAGGETCIAAAAFEELPDARAGIDWYNSISRAERAHWHQLARSAVPADAWRAFQAWEDR